MINNLPNGWELKEYSKVFKDITSKKKKIPTNDYLENGDIPVIDQGQKYISGYTNDSLAQNSDKPVIIFGDHTRALKYIDFNYAIGADGVKVLKNIEDNSNTKFLYYALKNSYIPNTGYNRHFKYLKRLEFSLPPLQQQEKIVKVLDLTSNLIEKQKKLLEKYDLFIKSKFIEMFGDPIANPMGWEVVKLGEYTTLVSSGSTPKGGQSVYLETGEIKFIRSQNVRMNKMNYDGIYYISEEIFNKMKRTQVQYDDVLLNITGASIGRTAIYKDNLRANVNQHVCIIRLKNYMNNIYINYFIGSDSFQNQILSNQSGATREALNFTQIKNFNISYPSIELQNKFASIVEKCEIIIEKENQKLKQLEDLHNSLMQKAFKGEIE